MKRVREFGAFWYDFIVGDDWVVAVGVVAALGATYGLSRVSEGAWWVLPVAVIALLSLTLVRETHHGPRRQVTEDPSAAGNVED